MIALKRLWRFATDPKYMEFLDQQTRHIKSVKVHYQGKEVTEEEYRAMNQPPRPATIVDMESPLDVFPTDDPEKQDGDINSLTR